jgi:hypothetical protein
MDTESASKRRASTDRQMDKPSTPESGKFCPGWFSLERKICAVQYVFAEKSSSLH